ncbi:MAG TPA: integrase [Streptosporangiaceae bacterium]|nr:integrase [Streptosporangiaceae bacterium]
MPARSDGPGAAPPAAAASPASPSAPASPASPSPVISAQVVLATEAGTPGWPNEDFAAVGPGAAVLLDGATTIPRGTDTGCQHGVAWYAAALGATYLAAITATPPVPLGSALAESIADVRARHEATCDLTSPATPAATVTALRAEPGGVAYLALSDSTVAADYGPGLPPVIITDPHRAAGADPGVAARARTGILPLDGLRAVALLSDGAARITDKFGLLGWPAVLEILRTAGPAELISQVRQAEASDPDAERWPRIKLKDDATALWWPLTD